MTMKKLAAFAAISALGLGAFVSTGAEAQYGRYGGYYGGGYGGYYGGYHGGGYRYRRNNGGAIAAGAIFGLAAGAILASATAPAYGYHRPARVYYAPPRRRVVTRVVTYPAYAPYYGGYYGGGYYGRGYYGW